MLSSKIAAAGAGLPPAAASQVERIVLLGQAAHRRVVVRKDKQGSVVPGVVTLFDAAAGTLTVRAPMVSVSEEWTLSLVS